MEKNQNLLVGFDLCDDFSRISCYNNITFEPETIKYDYNSESELLPTIMAYKEETDEWIFANEAVEASKEGNVILIDNIVEAVKNNKMIIVNGQEFLPTDILASFFRKSLSLIRRYHPNDNIKKMIVTIEKTHIQLVKGIFIALEKLNIYKDRVSVQSHSQSFMYYAMSQKKELWMNDVALFHYDKEGLKYFQVNIDRRHRPATAGVWEENWSDKLSYQMIKSDGIEVVKDVFEKIAVKAFYKQVITTVYMTGIGFEGKWVEKVVTSFSQGKRLFKGQSLFSDGACYAAREISEKSKLQEYILMSEDMVGSSISVRAYFDATEQELPFVKSTETWYEVDKSYEFILNDSNEIEIIVKNALLDAKKSFIIAMDLTNPRPNKTTRVRVNVRMADAKTCVITMKDLGFGDFYPASNRVWEKIIKL